MKTSFPRTLVVLASLAASVCLAGVANAAPAAHAAADPGPRAAIPAAESFFSIVEDRTGSCIDVPDRSTTDGARLQQFRCNNTVAQKFSATNLGNGFFLLPNQNSRLCVRPENNGFSFIIQTLCRGDDPGQQWQLVADPQSPSNLFLQNALNFCLQLNTDDNHDHTQLSSATCVNDNRMFWHFV
jgi:hypothetical protein